MESHYTCAGTLNPITPWLRSSLLGSGSFAHVSLALNLLTGSLFAVKSTPCPSSSSPLPSSHPLAMAQNELRILQSLHSPHIIRCLGAELSPSSFNLFLEYMHGGSLANLIKQSSGKLDESRARLYTRSILQGLDYLHQNGIVHCDIKGQNILIGQSGVKIADFGAAKRLEKESEISSGQLKGTPLWMAPEVIQGKEQGCPSDIWSLGCTVVEMLQGRPPWGHIAGVPAALYKIGYSEESPALPSFISEEARDFVGHCLQRDAKERWTAAELLQHPFVSCRDDQRWYGDEVPSPRSALEFVHSYQSDWEDDSDGGSIPVNLTCPFEVSEKNGQQGTALVPARAYLDRPTDAASSHSNIPATSEWVTVRRGDGWSSTADEERESGMPFMSWQSAAAMPVPTNRSGVSLDAAAFLRRNRKVVG